MSLTEDLEAFRPEKGRICSVAWAKEKHPELEDEIESVVMNRDYSASLVRSVLIKNGVTEIRKSSIFRHRGGECACDGS